MDDELPSVYVETSLLSYLTARPSTDLIVAANQELSRQWWELRRSEYRLCVSDLVTDEAARGNPEAASRRLKIASKLEHIDFDEESIRLSRKILESGIIPTKADTDAAHVAVSARHGMNYLATWNCRHIANATIMRRLVDLLSGEGYELPIICTPYALFGEDHLI